MNDNPDFDLSFFKNKRVLVTGYLGFKGSYLCKILLKSGAVVCGYGMKQESSSLFEMWGLGKYVEEWRFDVCDLESLAKCFADFQPELVFHLAAQALVLPSYRDPAETFKTNVMGCVNLFECVRRCPSVQAVLNVTSDKVYRNDESGRYYNEEDPLMGRDPYSASKSCAEIISFSYKKSFFEKRGVSLSTARAGNVLGGGDFSENRVIPDCVRAVKKGEGIVLRNPDSVRPYQHVFDCLYGYLLLMKSQILIPSLAGSYNFAPFYDCAVTTYQLASLFCKYWGDGAFIDDQSIGKSKISSGNGFHEAGYLKLDVSKAKDLLGFSPKYTIEMCMRKIVDFEKCMLNNGDSDKYIDKEIDDYFK